MNKARQDVKIAIGADFLTSFMKLPRQEQSKVSSFLEKFKANPSSPGINYEKINSCKDNNLRSVRIDEAYRGIILKTKADDVYLLLWVDKHDDAYEWARKRSFKVNAYTGSLQMLFSEQKINGQASEPEQADMSLFHAVKDKHLLKLGVPEELLPTARAIKTERDLDILASQFPQEAAEALYYLAAGYSLQETFNCLDKDIDSETKIDSSDVGKALENEDSMRRFHIVADSIELAEMLKAPMEKWRVFLHPAQRRLVEMDVAGPSRVLGGAGTGKTVVAMHRAKYLAEKLFPAQGAKILFTTFTKNLAEDIKSNMRKICPIDILARIEVINIDAWISQFLKKNDYRHEIIYAKDIKREFWTDAVTLSGTELGFNIPFYEQEWEYVVQENGIKSEQKYLNIPRIGRGVRLNRLQRKEIWKVFQEYRNILNRNNLKEPSDAAMDARIILEQKGDILPFSAIVVDEAQDMSSETFKLFRQMINPKRQTLRNDIFIVGDAHQRLYAHKVVLSKCDINIRGRSRKLNLNYRTTDEIRRWAVAILENREIDDLDGGQDNNKGYVSLLHGQYPEIKSFRSFEDELGYIVKELESLQKGQVVSGSICLTARSEHLIDNYEKGLNEAGIKTLRIRHSVSDDSRQDGVRIATMHRVKGLEFDVVFAAGVNYGFVPSDEILSECDPDFIKYDLETKERSLLYVAVTRARRSVYITSFGKPSLLIERR